MARQNRTFGDWVMKYNLLTKEKQAKFDQLSRDNPSWNVMKLFKEIEKVE